MYARCIILWKSCCLVVRIHTLTTDSFGYFPRTALLAVFYVAIGWMKLDHLSSLSVCVCSCSCSSSSSCMTARGELDRFHPLYSPGPMRRRRRRRRGGGQANQERKKEWIQQSTLQRERKRTPSVNLDLQLPQGPHAPKLDPKKEGHFRNFTRHIWSTGDMSE